MVSSSDPAAPRNRNHLVGEKSPYLLQHADNPVDWYPWSDDALALARQQQRPIFLSIGYATCHWCHVMEHESFEDPEVAALLNRTFVNIKVDREERPDIDAVYMTVCQLLTGSGGWPLTVIMTPDLKPFFAATYIPKESRYGRPGMLDLVPRVAELWRDEHERLVESAAQITDHLTSVAARNASGELPPGSVAAAYRELAARFDAQHGGFGSAPKFPSPHNLQFLIDYSRATGEDHGLAMAETTLRAMHQGGIFDHLGYGFHRYSTDAEWLVPHFEKMLYDQATHVLAAADAFAVTGRPEYATTVQQVAEYVTRDLRSPQGAFYSAEDADSEGIEGKFYVWTMDELVAALGAHRAELAATIWNARPTGNFHDEASGAAAPANILHRTASDAELAQQLSISAAEVEDLIEGLRTRLLEHRSQRIRPLLDDKILADWNGLMIAALARAGRLIGDPAMIEQAATAFRFVDTELRSEDGHLLHRWREGHAAIPGFLDDHVFLAWAATELYDATLDAHWLDRALALTDTAVTLFWDSRNGGFFLTSADAAHLLVRTKDATDGAIPAGNGVAAQIMLRLARLTGRADLEQRSLDTVTAFAADVARMPSAHTGLLEAAALASRPSLEVVIVGAAGAADTAAMLAVVRSAAPPHAAIVLVPTGAAGTAVRSLVPFAAAYEAIDDKATAYVCRGFRCDLPTTDNARLRELIARSIHQ